MKNAVVCVAAILFAIPLFPCDLVFTGGQQPYRLQKIKGVIVGSGDFALMGHKHDVKRHEQLVSAAKIRLLARKDEEYAKPSKRERKQRQESLGVMRWSCGQSLAEVTSDSDGKFDAGSVPSGKYCLEVIGPEPKKSDEKQMRAQFLVDIQPVGGSALVADISPLWPDCSGGPVLEVAVIIQKKGGSRRPH